jgi:hypothetical protein
MVIGELNRRGVPVVRYDRVDKAAELRRRRPDRLEAAGTLRSAAWRAAVEQVPRERFLLPGVFTAAEDGTWQPVTPDKVGAQAWLELAYSDESLVTQLDGTTVAAEVGASGGRRSRFGLPACACALTCPKAPRSQVIHRLGRPAAHGVCEAPHRRRPERDSGW